MITDPVEDIIARALDYAGVGYVRDNALHLDFYLPYYDTYIEVKQFHASRVLEQMSRHSDVIVIQGIGSARAFADLIIRQGGLK